MEQVPVTDILPIEIWKDILSFLEPTVSFMPAMVCNDFYQILKAKREKRGQKVWVTDISVFCKTPAWTKFVILTSRPNLAKQWPLGLNYNIGNKIRIEFSELAVRNNKK
jgi:hypothetical protein